MALPNAEKWSHILVENSKLITTAARYVSACHKLSVTGRSPVSSPTEELRTGERCRCRSLPITPPASHRSHGSRPRPTRHTHQFTFFNKLEYFIRPIKNTFLVNCWPFGKYVHLLYMYSILGRGSFCFNYCLNSAWHGGDQFVALLRWYGSPGFFDRGLQLICIFWSLDSNFTIDNTP